MKICIVYLHSMQCISYVFLCQVIYYGSMPYPAKTNAQTILTAAISHLEQYGEEALSIRELARILGLSPHALYRYYPDRAALEAAMADEGFRYLREALSDAVGMRAGKDALRVGAFA